MLQVNEEVLAHIIRDEPYKGWTCNYAGSRLVKFTNGEQEIHAHSFHDDWLRDAWLQIKEQIDELNN